MLDLKIIRENAEMIKANCQRRGFPLDIDGLLALDKDSRALAREGEEPRPRRNKLSKECASDPSAREEVKKIKLALGSKETAMEGINKKMMAVLTRIPNLLAPDVPDGTDDTE